MKNIEITAEHFDKIFAVMRYGYLKSFEERAGDSECIRKFFEDKPKGYAYYDFSEYEVAVSDGSEFWMNRGDRIIRAKDGSFHLMFRRNDGYTVKWGRTKDDNPTHCPWGNEIADIEITTACNGIRDKDGKRNPCAFCFPEGTNITMADGSLKDISEIRVGDRVLSYHNGQRVENVVKEVYCRDYIGKLIGGFANYSDRHHKPSYHVLPNATPEHPFMVRNGNEYEEVKATDLKYRPEAELLFDDNQDGCLTCLEESDYCGKVYNFHCEPNSMYFADGVLVHNCYKANTPNGEYMTFDTFKGIFDLMNQPKTMTQIAFGVDAECKTNPDVWKIMDYCLENEVVPNVTVADIDDATAGEIVKRCGACAVSAYARNLKCCYESIANLSRHRSVLNKKDFKINIHCLLSEETIDLAWKLLNDYVLANEKNDGREWRFALREVGAIVFLSLKQKGRGEGFHILPEDEYRKIIDFCFEHHIPFGMDSCGANKFLRAVEGRSDFNKIEEMVEECESTRCSFYVNAGGKAFPCSFMEGEDGWKDGVDLLDPAVSDYGKEIWHHSKVEEFRNIALKCIECRGRNQCPHYKV